jgi:dTMP kinase
VNRGKLIAFEGLDGSGKSTQLAMLAEHLRGRGLEVVTTREPTDGVHGRRIRAMARSGERVAPEEELRWFVEDRREHVEHVIAPALAKGHVVLTDRYYVSSVAYQGARGLDGQAILAQSERDFPIPDLVVVVDVPPDEGIERVGARGGAQEPVFEEIEFQRRVAAELARIDRDYVVTVDGRGSPEDVHARVRDACERALSSLG